MPEFAPLKLSAKSLKVTRPSLFSLLATQEETFEAAEKVFEAYKAGGLKVSGCHSAMSGVPETSSMTLWLTRRSRCTRSTPSRPKASRRQRKTSPRETPRASSSSMSPGPSSVKEDMREEEK